MCRSNHSLQAGEILRILPLHLMYVQGHALGEYAFVPPKWGRELVAPKDAMQQFFQHQ
jgi:hypothetical protein